MKIYFKDELFDAQFLRALSHAYYGGADLGECFATAQRIAEPSADSWYDEWMRTAERIHALAEASLAAGHMVSAREAFLRASNYYHMAFMFMLSAPVDPRLLTACEKQTKAFRQAGALFAPPFEAVTIPYENTALPGYFFRADGSARPRPTLIVPGGYDGIAEELYFFNAAAALRHGYNCLCFDGPGQGAALIRQQLVFRPDWECVVRPVVDYLLGRPEVDGRRLVLMGTSFGGLLAPRAASGEHRLAALVLDPGQYDLADAVRARLPGFMAGQIEAGQGLGLRVTEALLNNVARQTTRGWALRRGMWTHGVGSALDYVRSAKDYTNKGYAEQITCPTLVCYADHDEIAAQARQLYEVLKCPKEFMTFSSAEGAGEHCEDGNRSLFHQRVFDWLDQTLGWNG